MASFSPFGFISILLQFWPFGKLLCLIVTPFQCVFVFVSAWTLVVLSLERWWVIVGKAKWRKGLVFWAIGGVWIFSLVVSLPVGLVVGVRDAGNERMLCEEVSPCSVNFLLFWHFSVIKIHFANFAPKLNAFSVFSMRTFHTLILVLDLHKTFSFPDWLAFSHPSSLLHTHANFSPILSTRLCLGVYLYTNRDRNLVEESHSRVGM